MLQRLPVDSSSLASIGYSAAERVLEVEFRHGAVYRYLKVAPETYEALLAADSKGRYFNDAIRGHHPFLRV